MKPFKINRKSWHYWVNTNILNEDSFSMERSWEPRHNNFCSYWRATMFRLVFLAIGIALVGMLFTIFGIATYEAPLAVLSAILLIVGVVAAVIGGIYLKTLMDDKKKANGGVPTTLVGQWYASKKSRICPQVEFTE